MSLYAVPNSEAPTEHLPAIPAIGPRTAAPSGWATLLTSTWLRRAGLVATVGMLVALTLNRTVMPMLLPYNLGPAIIALMLVLNQLLIVAKWSWDRQRIPAVESRLFQGQADIRSQTALLRSELHALLGALPEGVGHYADDRATEAWILGYEHAKATGTDGGIGQIAPVRALPAHRSRN